MSTPPTTNTSVSNGFELQYQIARVFRETAILYLHTVLSETNPGTYLSLSDSGPFFSDTCAILLWSTHVYRCTRDRTRRLERPDELAQFAADDRGSGARVPHVLGGLHDGRACAEGRGEAADDRAGRIIWEYTICACVDGVGVEGARYTGWCCRLEKCYARFGIEPPLRVSVPRKAPSGSQGRRLYE